MKELKTFQDWCIDTLVSIINNKKNYRGTWEDQGYKYTIKSIINHYASMYFAMRPESLSGRGKMHLNIWWDHLNDDNVEDFVTPLLMSQNAYEVVRGRSKEKIRTELRVEHITPMGYIYEKLKRLSAPVSREEIDRIFRHDKVVLLHKELESDKYLDEKGVKFEEGDVVLLERAYPKECELIAEGKLLVGKKSPKSDGSGLLRLCRLAAHGVNFRLRGKDVGVAAFLPYLKDRSWIID